MPVVNSTPSVQPRNHPSPTSGQNGGPAGAPSGGTSAPAAPADPVVDGFEASAKKSTLKKAERLLKKAGFRPGDVDGTFSKNTRQALEQFQQAMGLDVTGTLSKQTLSRLEAVTERMQKRKGVLGPGQRSARIRTLEKRLRRLGYNVGKADGIYGQKTADAVRAFKKAEGMKNKSGLLGENAQKELRREVQALNHAPYRTRVENTDAHQKADRRATVAARKERADGQRGLARGMKGAAVRTIRQHLKVAGYDAGVGEKFTARTEAMVKVFQEKVGLEPTGRVNGKTWKELRKVKMEARGPTSPHQRVGERSGAVERTEKLLKKLGYSPGPVDGHYDARTQKAVDRFRKKKGLGGIGDGVGPNTLKALQRAAKNTGSKKAKRQMRNLLAVAKRNAEGKRPLGWCLKAVQDYLDQVTYGKGRVPRLPYARNYAEYLNRDGNAARLGLKRLSIDNPYDAPPGAIVVVRPGTPGTAHPTAGDIVVKGHGSNLYNDGEMSYGGPANFPPGNNYVLGVYVPEGYKR